MNSEEKLMMLEEMEESMEESLDNIVKVAKQQNALIEVIETSSKAEEFKEFCGELKTQLQDLDKQRSKLLQRKDILHSIIAECKESETSKILVKKMLDVFGIFEER